MAFHGTAIPKTSFRREGGAAGVGIYFTSSYDIALDYAERDAEVDGEEPIVIKAMLSLHNPLRFENENPYQSMTAKQRDKLEIQGYDGIVVTFPDGIEYIVFNSEQVKIID